MKRFRRTPTTYIDVPHHIDTVFRTQGIAERHERPDALEWALAVVSFLRKRAANILTRRALTYIYHPNGPWLRHRLIDFEQSGLATF